jgi:hypothetical protein
MQRICLQTYKNQTINPRRLRAIARIVLVWQTIFYPHFLQSSPISGPIRPIIENITETGHNHIFFKEILFVPPTVSFVL